MICEYVFESPAGGVTHTVYTIKNVIINITQQDFFFFYHNELQELSPLHYQDFLKAK